MCSHIHRTFKVVLIKWFVIKKQKQKQKLNLLYSTTLQKWKEDFSALWTEGEKEKEKEDEWVSGLRFTLDVYLGYKNACTRKQDCSSKINLLTLQNR